MELRLIRNATLRLNYAGLQILIDPFLAEKGSLPSFAGRAPNPMTPLPCTPEEIIAGAELLLVSHLHGDHFDGVAQQMLPKAIDLICRPGHEDKIREKGFTAVAPLEDVAKRGAVTITRTMGRHGTSEAVLNQMGEVCGFILQADGEPTIYWAGDTVWYEAIEQIISQYQPDIIITHSCGAVWGDKEFIVMDDKQTLQVCKAAPNATVVAVHMEALDHATVDRARLRATAAAAGVSGSRLLIPADGAVVGL